MSSTFAELLRRLGRDEAAIILAHTDESGLRPLRAEVGSLDNIIAATNERQQNLYFEINATSHSADYGRSSAREIRRLNALWVDVDYKGSGMGDEAAAYELIADLTGALGAPPAAVVHSGNGLQPYWPIADGEITEATGNRILTILARWKALVDTFAAHHGGDVDSLFDLPRIFRVPGTFNWKIPTEPKPVTVDFPDEFETFTLDEVEAVLDDWGVDARPREMLGDVVEAMAEWDWADHDCEYVDLIRQEILHAEVKARHPWMLAHAAVIHGMIRFGCITEHAFEELRGVLWQRHQDLCRSQAPFREPRLDEFNAALNWGAEQVTRWSDTKLVDEMRQHVHTDFIEMLVRGPVIATPPPAPEQPQASIISMFTRQVLEGPTAGPEFPTQGQLAVLPGAQAISRLTNASMTDAGNAELFAQAVAGRFIYVSGTEIGWHFWDGIRWAPDTAGLVREALKDLFVQRLASTTDLELKKWLTQSLNNARMNATLKWAETVTGIQTSRHELDGDPYELVTPAGIVDLRTGNIRPADPIRDRNTKSTSLAPDWTAPPKRLLTMLQWAFADQPEQIGYLQRLFGLALIGQLRAQVFPIIRGPGGNGKSVLVDVCLGVLGSYAMKLGQQFLVQTRSDQHPEQVAQLRGVRIAFASEVNASAKFNEELVKALTGDGTTRARLLYENSSEFDTSASIFLFANHLPSVQTGGPAWWRRVRCIDMPRIVPEADQVEDLARIIVAEEGGQVLAWMIAGLVDYLANGEQVPDAVTRATARYRSEEDTIARYVDTRVVLEAGQVTTRNGLYQDYQQWANSNRIFPVLSEPKFIREFLSVTPGVNAIDDDPNVFGVRLAHPYNMFGVPHG